MQRLRKNATLRLVLIYGTLSGLWIFFSDRILLSILRSPDLVTSMQTYKGLAFIAFSATLLYIMVERQMDSRRREQEELNRYRLMSDSTNTVVFFSDPATGALVDANAAAVAAYGYDRSELRRMTQWQLRADGTRPPEITEIMARGGGRLEALHRRKSGQIFPASVTITSAEDNGSAINLVVVQDMTRQHRLQAMQEMLHEIDHQILQKQPIDEILQSACEEVVRHFDFMMAYIGLKEADGSVRTAATAGPGKGRVDGLLVLWGPVPNGPTGRAIATGQPQFTRLVPDPRMNEGAEMARLYGPWVCLSLPLSTEDETVGALSLYAQEEHAFDEETEQQLRQFANQVALSIRAARDQEQIHLQTEALEAAANSVLIGDAEGRPIWVNRAWTQLTGYTAEEVIGHAAPPARILSDEGAQDWPTALANGPRRVSREVRRRDGSTYYVDETITPVRSAEGRITHMVSIAQDVTDRRQQEEHLRFLALHDPLTGLLNRLALQEGLERVLPKASLQRPGAMLLIDLDHFKVVNETVGDQGGDDLLISLTSMLQGLLRSGDLLVRFSGDQFALLIENIAAEAARARAEGLRQAIGDFRFQHQGLTLSINASVGVAMIDGTLDPSGVKSLASAALLAAKENGRNQTALYRSDLDKPTDLAEENRVAALIKEALRENRFSLHFQPIVHLSTGSLEHYEALIRLRQPDGTFLPPAAFLGAAERFRLMPAIDRWVLEEALNQLYLRPNLTLFVNLSGQSLNDESLLAYAESRLRSSAGLAGRLSFEITETAAVRDMERVKLWMGQLKGLGCRFALDDFGVGFSSFAYLRFLPADFVKIDGAFIRNLDTDPTNRSLVQAMYTAARALGKIVVAEWVENEAIAQVLREVGVEFGQGYRWGKPLPGLPE